jgi:hypothetical protein
MRAITLPLAVAAIVAGCATPPPPPPPAQITTLPPTCITPRYCEAMWLKAQDAAGRVTGMRLRLSGPDRLETFAPSTHGRLGAVVTKAPQADGAYQVRAEFRCYHDNGRGCANQIATATNLFNTIVGPSELPR